MAIKSLGFSEDGKRTMSMEEFRKWIKTFDEDKDGRIDKEELAHAVHDSGGWFAWWKGRQAVQSADSNGNGFVDESEFNNLVEFAQKNLGIKIIFP